MAWMLGRIEGKQVDTGLHRELHRARRIVFEQAADHHADLRDRELAQLRPQRCEGFGRFGGSRACQQPTPNPARGRRGTRSFVEQRG